MFSDSGLGLIGQQLRFSILFVSFSLVVRPGRPALELSEPSRLIGTMNGSIWPPQPLQICLIASKKKGNLVSAIDASAEDRNRAEEVYYPVILQYTGGPANLPYELRYMTPNPILISNQFLKSLREFHNALSIALTNIVERWFTDEKAAFPTRMPLEQHEEDLLRVCYH